MLAQKWTPNVRTDNVLAYGNRGLRRADVGTDRHQDVIIPTNRLVTVGDRAFTAAGSRLWNSLPPDIRSAQTLPVFCNRLTFKNLSFL